ncbi:hypothetical protein KFV08_07955 [Macrococcoides canis]|uniref:hypothetical protein n=1 Tax=Macrococcoides canis TaxID=1855823 RepID=UPI00207C642F|nr:hypothetical protein [Macrococcus canis]MCO4095751.1 hypothetical protein [Macrococcus canis]UTH08458.1 hypothetical protein KFV08_07955 [Macrococcus canis]
MRTNKSEREFPVLLAFPDEHNHLHVWCPYCVKFHHHGVGEGHRTAHCSNQKSPFIDTGYVLKLGSKEDYKKTSIK